MKRIDTIRHPVGRGIFIIFGVLFLTSGVIGIVLPVLPTTPFLLLSAACFARSSPRFHQWLRGHRLFGAAIRDWEDHRSMRRRVKVRAYWIIVFSFTLTITLFIDEKQLKLLLVAVGLILMFFLYRVPVREEQVADDK